MPAQRPGVTPADACRVWLAGHSSAGVRVIVPEVADYELRRELLRAGLAAGVTRLDELNANPRVQYLALTTASMRLAAELWADARRRGAPTADPHALDGDVILAAQALSAGMTPSDFVVATTNVDHIAQFVPAEIWTHI